MNAPSPQVLPVIHHLDAATTFSEILVARTCGADGVFLISHDGADLELLDVARTAVQQNTGFPIGLNLLSMRCVQSARKALEVGSNMLWADDMGVDSQGLTAEGREMESIARLEPQLKLFACVAFKYRPQETDPVGAAAHARAAGFIPTTIGELAIQYRNLYRQRIAVFVPVAQVLAALFLSLAGVVLFGVAIVPLLQMTSGILSAV